MSNNELKPGSWVVHKICGKAWFVGCGTDGMAVLENSSGEIVYSYLENLTPCVEPRKPIEAWAAINGDGIIMLIRRSEKQAKEYAAECSEPVRVVHLVEAPAEDAMDVCKALQRGGKW